VATMGAPQLKQRSQTHMSLARSESDGLDSFNTETGVLALPESKPAVSSSRKRWTAVAIGLLGVIGVGASMATSAGWVNNAFAVTPQPATLAISTTPAGADVSINNEAKGRTPLSLTMAAGTYQLRLMSPSGQERVVDVTLTPGQSMVQQIEWASVPAAVATTGALHVQTDPPGQAVFVDDQRRGVSPLTVTDLTSGEHRLVVTSEGGSYRRAVTIKAGETLSVVVAPGTPVVSAGWVRVASPILLQVRSQGDLIGNSESDRVMLPAGEHTLELVNESLGFARTERVRVAAGRTAEVRVAVPNGLLSINALPWAEVWLNGERVGDTPLANISRPIGTYRVTFRHPQFGEKQSSVTVTTKGTTRLGVDMRQQ
jgi:hypothetical protein